MRPNKIWIVAALASVLCAASPAFAFTANVRMTADNFFAGYSGTPNAAVTQHFAGAWSAVTQTTVNTPNPYLYVVAWDDGATYQGLLGTVQVGSGFVATGSPLWEVCAANQLLSGTASAAPNTAALTAKIVACNSGGGWHAPSAGPANGNSGAAGLWGQVGLIDGAAQWIWNTNRSPACAAQPYGFLKGPCNPGEYLIFRLNLDRASTCRPPVPSFTVDTTSGYGVFSADGTASQFETRHFWSVEESNASWGRIGPEIMSWFPGAAGVFDLKTFYETGAKKRLKCNTYYRVKLAVGNDCIGWRETTKLVYLACCPGGTKTIQSPPTR